MVESSNPILPKFQFRDEKGKIYTLDSPILQRFFLTLWKRTGGSSDAISASSDDIALLEASILALTNRVSIVETRSAENQVLQFLEQDATATEKVDYYSAFEIL